jgi:heat shock protein HslJ
MKAIFFSLLLLLASCSGSDNSAELLNKEWHLEIFEDVAGLPAGAHQVPQDEHYILVLNDTAARGTADCNTFQGFYKLDGDNISFSNFAITEMDCGNDSLAAVFLKALSSAQKYSLKNGTLRIRYGKDRQLVFQTEKKR